MRSYDQLVVSSHFNSQSQLLTLNFAHPEAFSVLSSQSVNQLFWNLPCMQECGVPLAMTSDEDKLIVAYDSNKMAVFDLLNKCLHEWTVANIEKLPSNFLTRYNRIVGVVAVSKSRFMFYTNYTYFVLDL